MRRQIRRRLRKTKKKQKIETALLAAQYKFGWLFIYNGILLNAINLIKFLLYKYSCVEDGTWHTILVPHSALYMHIHYVLHL